MKINKEDLKTNEILLKKLLKAKNEEEITKIIANNTNIGNFTQYFETNIKKSLFFARILPMALFLIISLVSFSLLILSQNNENLKVLIYDNKLQYGIFIFACILLILSICLFIQIVFMKTRVVFISNGYGKGYCNIKKEKCLIIINNLKKVKYETEIL